MKVGIAFAGGGVRGAAHLGILQALEEQGIQADYYAGTSAGSIIATMKALGYSNETCLQMIEGATNQILDVAYWDIIKSMPSKFKTLNGVLKGDKLKSYLSSHLESSLLMNVKKDLSIITTDVNTGTQVIFSSSELCQRDLEKIDDQVKYYGRYTPLPLTHMVYASCAIPGVFRPMIYDKMMLVDGSVTNNLPANVLKVMGADIVIAIDLSKRNPNTNQVEGLFNIVSQSVGILIGQNTYLSTSKLPNVYRLNPDLTSVGLLDFDKVHECYEAGYTYGKRVATLIRQSIEKESLQ